MQQTVFYPLHVKAGAKMVEFCGWQMPINYGSQIKEHEAVRTDAGMFDVSHMIITDISGVDAKAFLRHLMCNDVHKLEKSGYGKALYSGMLNHNGGVIDDLIVYYMPFGYRLVTNAGTYVKDMEWIKKQAQAYNDVTLTERKDLAILAVQGPNAIAKISQVRPDLLEQLNALKPFMAVENNGSLYARTGYTGENGLEIMLTHDQAMELWDKLLTVGVKPCGLGARDTLRLEAGMNLYGHDMDESISPSECGMDWVVDLTDEERNFIGKEAYTKSKNTKVHQVGLVMQGKGILREGQKIFNNGTEIGVLTSGTFSPTLKLSLGIARINTDATDNIFVEIRGSMEPAKIVKLPFVRNNQQVFK